VPLLLLGLTAGALRATNTWDFPTYLLVGGLALAAREWARRAVLWRALETVDLEARLAFLFRSGVAVLWRAVILTAVAIVTFYPYSRYYATAYAGLQAWNEAKTQIPDYLIVHGFFLALIVIYLVSELGAQTAKRKTKDENGGSGPAFILGPSGVSYVLAAMIVVLAGGLALKAQVWLLALPLATLAAVLAFGRDLPPQRRLALLLIALGLAITMGVEVVRQKDDIGRMNTVFKFYVQAWVLMAVGSAAGLGSWANRALSWRPGWRRLAWALTAALFVGVMLYPAFAARAKIRDRFSAEASPSGLDGMAYMERAQYSDNNRDLRLADDRAAMLWMMQSITGSPVILEAQTPEYRWGSRFSIYTGLPAVQGWNWHQRQQRSVAPAVVERRVNHVREIYETTDLARARKLLETYRVSYIVVGELERAYYNARGLAKFEALVSQGYLVVAYRGGAVTIYEVVGGGVVVGPEKPQGVGPQPVPTPTAPASRPLIFESPVK
jgi:YYY domain-containing protein